MIPVTIQSTFVFFSQVLIYQRMRWVFICRAGDYLACPSTTAAAIDSVNFVSVAPIGVVYSIFFCVLSQNSRSSSNEFFPARGVYGHLSSQAPTSIVRDAQKKNWSFRGVMLWDAIIPSPYIFCVNKEIFQKSGGECIINYYICSSVWLGWVCEEYNKNESVTMKGITELHMVAVNGTILEWGERSKA
jgi:hypothetical protein